MISENKFEEHINNFSKQKWESLFQFIPLVKRKNGNDDFSNFLNVYCMELELQVIFNWQNWEQGKVYLESQQFESLDLLNTCKLITLILRADRFYEGFFASQIQEGNIYKIMAKIKERVLSSNLTTHNLG